MTGCLNIFKTPGMTSHGVVAILRRLTGIKKIGHAGTLDPQAAGVLPVCIGPATKMIPYLDHRKKTYRVEMIMGIVTDTQDTTGVVLKKSDALPEPEKIKTVLEGFLGEYMQIPPMYSAIKHKGKKLYELARSGQEVPREPRKRIIHGIRWVSNTHNTIVFDVDCSEGTYVRTLCHDAGQKQGCGAAMGALIRTESCRLSAAEAVTLQELEDSGQWQTRLMPVDALLAHHPSAIVDIRMQKKILNGVAIEDFNMIDHSNLEVPHNNGSNEKMISRVYLGDRFIGMGGINLNEKNLSMVKLLPFP